MNVCVHPLWMYAASLLDRDRNEQKDRRYSTRPLQIDLGAETGLVNSSRPFQRPDALNDRQFQRTLREKASFVDLVCVRSRVIGTDFLGVFTSRSVDKNLYLSQQIT